jgi:putative ABC transport system permease protein
MLAGMETLLQDLRYAVRGIRRHRGLIIVTVATLAIGIASVTTIFSFVNSALFRPLPYPDAERIVALSEQSTHAAGAFSQVALETVREIRRGTDVFQRIAAFRDRPVTVAPSAPAVQVQATEIGPDVLPLLGAHAQRGRVFTAGDIRSHAPLLLLSDRLWRTHFGARDDVIGRTVRMSGTAYTVVGVMQPGFRFYERSDLWMPLDTRVAAGSELDRSYSALARLRRGVSREQARREGHVIGQRLAAQDPHHYADWSIVVRDGMVDRGVRAWRPFAILFLGAAVCVLLVACSNVATLLLARSAERRSEMAVRASLGASRRRLLRQNLTESALIAFVAGVSGTLLSMWGIRLMLHLVPTANFPSWVRFGIDGRVLAFTVVLSLLAVFAFGLLPALEGTRVDLVAAMKGGDTGASARGGTRRGRIVIVVEMAAAVILSIAVALVGRSYRNATSTDPGFDATRVLTVQALFDGGAYTTRDARARYYAALMDRLRQRPGVGGVASRGWYAGMRATSIATGSATARRATATARTQDSVATTTDRDAGIYTGNDLTRSAITGLRPFPSELVVSDDYFRVLGLPLLRGRTFGAGDTQGSSPVVVVSERLARHLWPGENPLGRTLRIGKSGTPLTVVGVATNARPLRFGSRGLHADPLPDLYLSTRQALEESTQLLVRATADPAVVASSLAGTARTVDRNLALSPVRTLAEEMDVTTIVLRAIGSIMSVFAASGLCLALMGIFGVIAHTVARRTSEIGIRMALGATPPNVIRLVMRDGVRLIAIGLGTGLIASVALSRALRLVLLNVSPLDALTYAGVAALFTTVALIACYLPARRATRVAPASALRQER